MKLPRKIWQVLRNRLPVRGFRVDRPIVVLQSDDWGRVGVRDRETFGELRAQIPDLGERPYDFYSLETAEDLASIRELLTKHRDSTGQPPCLGMNFIVDNLDFKKMATCGFRELYLLPLADGLPEGWVRPGLVDAYRAGIKEGVFSPALHGTTHFCRSSVEPVMNDSGDRGALLRVLWEKGTPYIYSRMRWIGYEYWNPNRAEDERFEPEAVQRNLIGQGVGAFAKLFSSVPGSACAPGYRSNEDTHQAWAELGVKVAQNGPGGRVPPYIDRHGLLQTHRNVELEPAVNPSFSMETCIRAADECIAEGVPVVVSVHSINFHSALRDFRSATLKSLDELMLALESKYSDLLYLRDEDLFNLITKGRYENRSGTVRANVTSCRFVKANVMTENRA